MFAKRIDLSAGAIVFVGPQTGAGEERLVDTLRAIFAKAPRVRRAYLVRVRYPERANEDIALCLVGEDDDVVIDAVQRVYFELFNQGEHLDVFFVTAAEELRLAGVSQPFYDVSA